MFIDSHCHLDRVDLSPYSNDLNEYIKHATEDQLEHMLCVSINWEDYPNMRDLVKQHPQVSISVGVHPNEINGYDPTLDELIQVAKKDNVVAIGETGLDYYYLKSAEDKEKQHQRFKRHIQAAIHLNKPLIIHNRDAKQDTIKLLREEGAEQCGGVIHCFTEDWEMAQQAMDIGFYISFSGIVTFKNAAQIQEVAAKIPADRYLIETDSPYLAPVPRRGKPNYPNYVKHVAEKVAELRGESLETVAKQSKENYQRLFNR